MQELRSYLVENEIEFHLIASKVIKIGDIQIVVDKDGYTLIINKLSISLSQVESVIDYLENNL